METFKFYSDDAVKYGVDAAIVLEAISECFKYTRPENYINCGGFECVDASMEYLKRALSFMREDKITKALNVLYKAGAVKLIKKGSHVSYWSFGDKFESK